MTVVTDYLESNNFTITERDNLVDYLDGRATEVGDWWPAPDLNGTYNPATDPNALSISGKWLQKAGVNHRLMGVSLVSLIYADAMALLATLSTDTLNVNVVRIPIIMYDNSDNGWAQRTDHDSYYETLILPAVEYCNAQGWYVIIDCHIIENWNEDTIYSDIRDFWTFMAVKFKGNPMVLFEMANEPINPSTNSLANWTLFRDRYQNVINLIRYYAPYNVIICGYPSYSTRTKYILQAPMVGANIIYCFHAYPNYPGTGNYTGVLEDFYAVEIPADTPIFWTECGFSVDPYFPGDVVNATTYNVNYPVEQKEYYDNNPHVNFCVWSYGDTADSLSLNNANGAAEKAWLETLLP